VTYLDSTGAEKAVDVPLFTPRKDSTKKDSTRKRELPAKPDRPKLSPLLSSRSLVKDSLGLYATLTLNTFNSGRLRPFFRKTFRELRKEKIGNLVIDIRSNGGGKVWASTLLTKYISRTTFKVSDSAFAVSRGLGKYSRYVKWGWLNSVEMFFISRRKKDGLYHVRVMEKRIYQPKKRNHYDGKVYVLTNGPTFSASALFCNAVKGQPGVVLLGEETGGGWHGNSGIMIPDIKLPHTKNTVRLPLYRIVQYNHVPKTGSGIPPDIYVGTNYDALLKGIDYKMKVVKDMIGNGHVNNNESPGH
jgi:C-terminal processing protease CtpA/Prc